jgi:hypothetical protein
VRSTVVSTNHAAKQAPGQGQPIEQDLPDRPRIRTKLLKAAHDQLILQEEQQVVGDKRDGRPAQQDRMALPKPTAKIAVNPGRTARCRRRTGARRMPLPPTSR